MLPLSIVTPVFNSAAYLPAALDSLARIAAEPDHLGIDGGSTDGTVELLRARNARDRGLMVGLDRLTRAVLPALPRERWPHRSRRSRGLGRTPAARC
jgi:GT2 family glycosyltransferase